MDINPQEWDTEIQVPEWLQEFAANSTCAKGDLTSPLAVFLQVTLGVLAFTILILKRHCEPENAQRSWLVWYLDTSKQGINMLTMHMLNIILPEIGTQKTMDDPCTYYLASFILDTSIGIGIIYVCLKFLEFLIVHFKILGGYKFGEYKTSSLDQTTDHDTGRRLPFSAPIWLLQTGCYFVVTLFEKFSTFQILSIKGLLVVFEGIRGLLTKWVHNKNVEVALALFVIPLILNCFMFWIVDNILMRAVGRRIGDRELSSGDSDEDCDDDFFEDLDDSMVEEDDPLVPV